MFYTHTNQLEKIIVSSLKTEVKLCNVWMCKN